MSFIAVQKNAVKLAYFISPLNCVFYEMTNMKNHDSNALCVDLFLDNRDVININK